MNNNNPSAITHSSDGRRYLTECESVRGLAIALVVVFHLLITLNGLDPQPQKPWYQSIWYAGDTGVTLFFVLSGFLLVQPFMDRRPYSVVNFYWNRALRILPLYWLAVVTAGIFHQQFANAVVAAVFMDVSITNLHPFGAVWWSLGVEAQFYLLLPPAMWLMSKTPRWAWVTAVGGLLLVGYNWVATADPMDHAHGIRDTIIGRWPAFACGMAVAWLHAHRDRLPTTTGRGRLLLGDLVIAAPLIGLALIADRISSHYGFLAHRFWYHHFAIEALLWSLFLLALLAYPSHLKSLFSNALLNRLGIWSYSIYLLHVPLLFFMLRGAEKLSDAWRDHYLLPVIAAYLVMALALSALTYRYIELPFLRLKRPTHPGAAPAAHASLSSTQ